MNAFRRPGKKIHTDSRDWSSWLDANSELVATAGLPATAIETEELWWYFIDRTYTQAGYVGDDIWFDVGRMSSLQRSACMTLIEQWIADRAPDLNEAIIRQLRSTYGPSPEVG